MKQFVKIFVVTLILVELFLFFGGYRLFDFSRGYYRAGAACALIIAVIAHGLITQAEKMEDLEKRIRALEKEQAQETRQ